MRNKKQWWFTRKAQGGGTENTPPQEQHTAKWYSSIHRLPLCKFIEVVCDDNLHALVITGNPTIEQLVTAWEEMYEQFTQEIGGGEAKMFSNIYREYTSLKVKYDQTLMLIDALDQFRHNSQDAPCREFAADLNRIMRTSYSFDHTQPDYDKNLKACRTRSGSMLVNLQMKEATFTAMQQKQSAGAIMDQGYFIGVLIALSDHAKFNITDRITVYEYCTRIKNLNLYLEQQSKQATRPKK